MIKDHLPIQEMWARSLDHRDTLEKEMATHANLLAWEIPWKEEPDGQQTFSEEAHKTVFKILDQKRKKSKMFTEV